MTSSKVIEAHPYRKAITTMDTTWCVSVSKTGKVVPTSIFIFDKFVDGGQPEVASEIVCRRHILRTLHYV
jgi:hypothetical protein